MQVNDKWQSWEDYAYDLEEEIERITNLNNQLTKECQNIACLQRGIARLNRIIRKTIKYIKDDMPYLEEPDDDYENNHKMQEYDKSILLKMLKGEDINE